jgi:hypothetical protein
MITTARSKWIVGLKLLPEDDPARAAGASVNEDRLARVMNAVAYLSAAIVSVDHADRVRRMTAVLERLQRSVPLHHGCSWSFRMLDRDQRTVPLYVALKDEAELSEHESGRMSMRIGGRSVLAHVPEVGSPASLDGELAFMLCSQTCADQLTAAIDEDIRLSVAH